MEVAILTRLGKGSAIIVTMDIGYMEKASVCVYTVTTTTMPTGFIQPLSANVRKSTAKSCSRFYLYS